MDIRSQPTKTPSVVSSNSILWTYGDRKFAIIPQFNPNPESSTTTASVLVFQCGDHRSPVEGGMWANIEYDFQTGLAKHYRSSCKCNCLEEPLKQALADTRERYLQWYRAALTHAKESLYSRNVPSTMLDDGMTSYFDLIPGEYDPSHKDGMFPAGSIIIHQGRRWWVTDQYCAEPECDCQESVLGFSNLDSAEKAKDDLIVYRKSSKSYEIREFDRQQLTREEAEELYGAWSRCKPFWFDDDEMRLRKRQLQSVKKRAIYQDWKLTANSRNPETPPPLKIGRNDPCPCGSGKKYKKCCL